MDIEIFDSQLNADQYVAKLLEKQITASVKMTGSAILGLSGGSTPMDCYKILARNLEPHLIEKLILIQVDERFVSSDNERSNQKSLREIFQGFTIYPMVVSDQVDTLEDAVKRTTESYRDLYAKFDKEGPDICLLGMGTDGHVASLFPENPDFISQLGTKNVAIIGTYVESQEENRISLSTSQINQSSKILYISGEEKLATFSSALLSGNVMEYPILSVLEDSMSIGVGVAGSDTGTVIARRFMLETRTDKE